MQTNEEIVSAIQAGNRDAIPLLYQQCYGFIRQHALRWARAWSRRTDFDCDDLTQCGYIALCEAVKGYQEQRGGFLGYLLFFLQSEFAKCAGCRTPAQARAPLNHATSLDAPIRKDDADITLGDILPTIEEGYEAIEEALYRESVGESVRMAVSSLPDRQRQAVEWYYLQGMTYNDVGQALGVSGTRAQDITQDGLKKLRTGEHAPLLSELLYGRRYLRCDDRQSTTGNLYRHTGLSSYTETGCSVQEREILRKEKEAQRDYRQERRAAMIRYCVQVRGMDLEEAEMLFPV